jgi:hypothetical protein
MQRPDPKGTTRVWLTYDLGVQGDYESLYSWLDEHKAVECGDSAATFVVARTDADPSISIAKSIRKNVKLGPRARIYLVRVRGETTRGGFIIGNRKAPPWLGASGEASSDDEEEG